MKRTKMVSNDSDGMSYSFENLCEKTSNLSIFEGGVWLKKNVKFKVNFFKSQLLSCLFKHKIIFELKKVTQMFTTFLLESRITHRLYKFL